MDRPNPMTVVIEAPAKINLFLEVVNRRKDNYHNIISIMQSVSLYDRITIEPHPRALSLSCNWADLPTDSRNLAMRAAVALKEKTGVRCGAAIRLEKNIPLGAGLGGGSSDAAGVLKGLINLWDIRVSRREQVQLATSLGADVPFFLKGGRARATNIGDRLISLPVKRKQWYILVNPGISVSTPWVYGKLRFPLTKRPENNRITKLFNRLEEVVLPHYPAIRKIKDILTAEGIKSMMSGSGATVFGIVSGEREGTALQKVLKKYRWKTWVVHTV
ncbi:MAG: 4-(cytidine 5'-diphospho)-2-C-methyl-D-erythritol kinase [Endomicrobiales bacterium]